MLRQLAARAAASSQLCSALSMSSLVLRSTRGVATEVSRGVRRGASNECDVTRSSLSIMIASSSGRNGSFLAFDSSLAPSTSYGLVSCWSSLGAQMRKRVRKSAIREERLKSSFFYSMTARAKLDLDLLFLSFSSPGLLDRERSSLRRHRRHWP